MFHVAVVFLTLRPYVEDATELSRRVNAFNALVTASSFGWVFLALESRAMSQWPISLLPPAAQSAASDMAIGAVVLWIGIYTVFVIVVYLAATVAFSHEASRQVPDGMELPSERSGWLSERGLSLMPQGLLARFGTLFLPLVAGSLDKIVEGIASAVSAAS
jgi:hypothetical protein